MSAHSLCPTFSRKLISLKSVEDPHPHVELFACLFENTNIFWATLDSKYALENSELQQGQDI